VTVAPVRPADYPPPYSTDEAIAAPTDPADERIDVGILIVGGGPGGLACAVRLGQLLEEHPALSEQLGEVPVAVLEKGKQAGSHLLSGAVVNPRALRRLFQGRPELVEKRIEDKALLDRYHMMGIGREETELPLRRCAELGMVAIRPRLSRPNDLLDVGVVQATQASQLIDHHLSFVLCLGFVVDLLKVTATALVQAKVGAGRLNTVGRGNQYLQ